MYGQAPRSHYSLPSDKAIIHQLFGLRDVLTKSIKSTFADAPVEFCEACQWAAMQSDCLPSLPRIVDATFGEIRGGSINASSVPPELLSKLHFLFDKDLQKALQIIERGQVKCYIAEQSQRKVFQVQGSRPADQYTVFPTHFCTCHAFLYQVVGQDHILCKHQLAARLAESLQCCQTVCVPDEVLAQLLLAT